MMRMGRMAWSGLALTIMMWITSGCESPVVSAGGGAMRIGTFRSRAVALAWGRSKAFNAEVKQLMADYKQAQTDGDEKRMAELKKAAEAGQAKMHRQVFGHDRIDDILAHLKDRLPAIARQAGVAVIAEEVQFLGGVETMDITDFLVKEFGPTKETLEIIEDLKNHPPVPHENLDCDCCK